MFFTEEDYRKIEKWLVSKGVMDTQFSPAAPLDGNETVAIVQNGKNVNATIDALVEKLFLLGVDDFLNVTDKYEQPAIPLIQAISLIPFRHRRIGQVITFLNEDNKWVIYQFQGSSLTQWNNTTQWVNVIGSAITGELVPDEEDLTGIKEGDKTVLKFKNKAYNTANFSGLGRFFLRKNISGGRNILTQQMINLENTIYHIQYDYDLNGQTITIPSGCVLEFEGGSFSNGTIVGTNLCVLDTYLHIFKDINVDNANIISFVRPEWFGAKGDGSTDDRIPLQTAINCKNVILTTDKVYTVNSYTTGLSKNHFGILEIVSGLNLIGEGTTYIKVGDFFDDKPFLLLTGFKAVLPEDFPILSDIKIDNITFEFNVAKSKMRTKYNRRIGIEAGKVFNIRIQNCIFRNGDLAQGISCGWLGTGNDVFIDSCEFNELVAEVTEGKDLVNKDHSSIYTDINNCKITNCKFLSRTKHMRRIGAAAEFHRSNTEFSNCSVIGYTRGHFIAPTSTNEPVSYNYIINNNNYDIANQLVLLWVPKEFTLKEVHITNNTIIHRHNVGLDSGPYDNGEQVIVGTGGEFEQGTINNVYIENNTSHCVYTDRNRYPNLAQIISFGKGLTGVVIRNNDFINHVDGIQMSDTSNDTITRFIFDNNRVYNQSDIDIKKTNYIRIVANTITDSSIRNNIITFRNGIHYPDNLISLKANSISTTNIDNDGDFKSSTLDLTEVIDKTFTSCDITLSQKRVLKLPTGTVTPYSYIPLTVQNVGITGFSYTSYNIERITLPEEFTLINSSGQCNNNTLNLILKSNYYGDMTGVNVYVLLNFKTVRYSIWDNTILPSTTGDFINSDGTLTSKVVII